MSDTNSAAAAQGKTVKNKRNKNKNKREKRQKTDINERGLTHPFRLLSAEKEVCLSMVGLDGAGKTTILKKLGVNVQEIAFDEFYFETLVYNNITINGYDLSGKYKTRDLGSHIFEKTKGLIFVVDSTDRDRLDRARVKLHKTLDKGFLHTDVPLVVFANKKDKHDGMKKDEIVERLGLSSPLGIHQCHLEMTSAITGEGIYEGLDWLCKQMTKTRAITGEGATDWLKQIRHLEEGIRKAKIRQESYRRKLGLAAYCLLNQVQDYERNEFNEVDELESE